MAFLFSLRKLIRAASHIHRGHAEQIRFSTRFDKSTLFIKPHCTPEWICGIERDAFALVFAKLCFRSVQQRCRQPRSLPLWTNSHATYTTFVRADGVADNRSDNFPRRGDG